MAALIAAGAVISLPLGSVPFTMQTFFVYLAGFVLGPKNGVLAVVIYICAGALGLPVFSGGKAGLAHLFSPTGGFIAGFVVCAAVCGLASKRFRKSDPHLLILILFGLLGMAALFGLGIIVLWLHPALNMTLWLAMAALGPFMAIDLVKLGAAMLIYQRMLKWSIVPN